MFSSHASTANNYENSSQLWFHKQVLKVEIMCRALITNWQVISLKHAVATVTLEMYGFVIKSRANLLKFAPLTLSATLQICTENLQL